MQIENSDKYHRNLLTTNLSNLLIIKEATSNGVNKASFLLGINLRAAQAIKDLGYFRCQEIAEHFTKNGLLLNSVNLAVHISQNLREKQDIISQSALKALQIQP